MSGARPPKRVLIVEPLAIGHHAHYVRWLVQAASRRQWNIAIATTVAAASHPVLRDLVAEHENIEVHLIQDVADREGQQHRGMWQLLRNDIASWRLLKRTVAEVHAARRVDAVILPYVEYWFHSLALLGEPFKGIPWCAISMRLSLLGTESHNHSPIPRKWRLATRILRQSHLRSLFVINPSAMDAPPEWHAPHLRARLRYLPDPAEDSRGAIRPHARASLNLASDAIAILVYGAIDGRKGADALVATLAADAGLADYVVILAGQQSEDMRELLQRAPYAQFRADRRLIVLDHFVDAETQGALFAAADIAWLGYRGHLFMSGVLVLAGRAGLPVLGTREGEIGRLVQKHRMGAVATIERRDEIGQALREMHDAATRTDMGQRARKAFSAHTVETFGDTVMGAFEPPP